MNLLWASNISSNSGYAIQARLFTPRIKAAGHKINILELANGSRLPYELDGLQVVPVGLDPLGSDVLAEYYRRFRAQATITLCDAWGFNADTMRPLNWFPLCPVDTQPVAPHVVAALQGARRPIAYSRYGEAQLRGAGFSPFYWPHAVDPAVWRPGDKYAARARRGIASHVFQVAFVGVNDSQPSRKGIPELLMAWQVFSAAHPDARLYLHTALHGNLPVNPNVGGVQIDVLVKTFHIDPATVYTPDSHRYRTGIPTGELVDVANASDVLVLPSRGEGFGLPLLEFQRAGCPVITTDFAAGAELCFGGWLVSGEPEWSWQNAIVMKPGVAALVEALEAAYEDRGNPARRAKAVEGAREYDVETVMSRYGLPVLRQIGEETLDLLRIA